MRLLAGLLALLLVPLAGALPAAEGWVFEGTGAFETFELGRSFPQCIPHPSLVEPLPGDLRVVLVHAATGTWALSFVFTHLESNALRTCVVQEDCTLGGDPRATRVLATCARDVLPTGYIQLAPGSDGYAFSSFLGWSLPVPTLGADRLRGTVQLADSFSLP